MSCPSNRKNASNKAKQTLLASLAFACLLSPALVSALAVGKMPMQQRHQLSAKPPSCRQIQMTSSRLQENLPVEIKALQDDIDLVRNLPRSTSSTAYPTPLLASVESPSKPSYRRLFTHETWKHHLGGSSTDRLLRCIRATPTSIIFRATWKSVVLWSMHALVVSLLGPKRLLSFASGSQEFSLNICGSAIGLLVVLRTNSAYSRLDEARELWGRTVHLSREIVAAVTAGWSPLQGERDNRIGTDKVVLVCRYLAAFIYAMRDELRDGDKGCDILKTLLPTKEGDWIASQRSRPMAIHGRLRRLLYEQQMSKKLPDNMHFITEGNLKDLALSVASCQRIFSSPIPPTMSRHGIRAMALFLFAMPFVMAGSGTPPLLNVIWTAIISFVFLGIDELGVQAEQPFQLIPLWQLCRTVLDDIDELVLHPFELDGNATG